MDVCCIIFSLRAQECDAPPSGADFLRAPESPPSSQHAQFTVLWDENALLWSKNRVRIHSFAEAKLPPGSELVLTFNAAVGSRSQSPA